MQRLFLVRTAALMAALAVLAGPLAAAGAATVGNTGGTPPYNNKGAAASPSGTAVQHRTARTRTARTQRGRGAKPEKTNVVGLIIALSVLAISFTLMFIIGRKRKPLPEHPQRRMDGHNFREG